VGTVTSSRRSDIHPFPDSRDEGTPGNDARPFRPPWWGRNGHVQTIWGALFRSIRLPLRRERLATPDGDFLDLDWLDGDGLAASAPCLLVLHGLEGSSRSHYVSGLLRIGRAAGWRGVALNFRSCSGELNLLPRFYHSGETGDLAWVVKTLVERARGVPIGAVGVSLGGNVLLKWLGEVGERAPAELRGAVGISVPFDVAACARVLDRGFHRLVYAANFLKTMRSKVIEKASRYPGFVDVAATRQARTFARYDRIVTAPLNGFRDEVDYWVQSSSGPYLARIRRPTLLLGAHDDPIVPGRTLPDPRALPPNVRAEFTARGGHAGFLEGRWPWRADSWAERRAVAFLTSLLRIRRDSGNLEQC
jgi:predicted alpha/beta-fold hydrolase